MLRRRGPPAEDDFYDKHLSVCGTKIAVYKFPKEIVRQRYDLVQTFESRDAEKHHQRDKNEGGGGGDCCEPYREQLKLKTTNVRHSGVCDRRLKEIRESVEVEDFERLLKQLKVEPSRRENAQTDASDKRNRIVNGVDVSNVYREFFQSHYDRMRDVIEERKRNASSSP